MESGAQLFDRKTGVVRSYSRKSDIFREEEPANRVYEISGTVCTCKMLKQGRRQIAGFYFAGDLLGLEAAGATNTLAAQAITDVKVRVVQKQTLRALAASDIGLSDRLLWLTARELARKQNLALFLSSESLERVTYFLIEMVQRNSPMEDRIDLPMSRQDIGDYLGLTIETVSRVIRGLERRGAIKVVGRSTIVLRNQSARLGAERLLDIFAAVKGRQPKTEEELDDWRASAEGMAATLFDLTTISRWGEGARS